MSVHRQKKCFGNDFRLKDLIQDSSNYLFIVHKFNSDVLDLFKKSKEGCVCFALNY